MKEEFPKYHQAGLFKDAEPDAIYIYQIHSALHQYTGLIACADIQDYLEGKIKKHEHTLTEKEEKQLQLLENRQAIVKPVLLTYANVQAIDDWMDNYIKKHSVFFQVYFAKEDQHHFLWQINTTHHIQKIQELFRKEVPFAYIADGHHRSSVAALHYQDKGDEIAKFNRKFLCAYFSFSEIDILDFNRIVKGSPTLSSYTFLKQLAELFTIRPLSQAQKPKHKHQISMYLDKKWYLLEWKKEIILANPASDELFDAELLNEKVLKNLLMITEVRTDPRIKYIEGPRGLKNITKQTDKTEGGIAFCLFPIQLKELVKKADAEQVLPPKSTWVEPRMKNGLIVQKL